MSARGYRTKLVGKDGKLRCELSPLTERERIAFQMVREGKTMRAVAEHFEVPEGTAAAWVAKAREHARAQAAGGSP